VQPRAQFLKTPIKSMQRTIFLTAQAGKKAKKEQKKSSKFTKNSKKSAKSSEGSLKTIFCKA
jgi:hypothetical protein